MAFPILGNPKPQFFDSSGDPRVSGTLETRNPANDALIDNYPTADDADAATNANNNPQTLDSVGGTTNAFFGVDGQAYKVVLKTSDGATVWTVDDINLQQRSTDPVIFTATAGQTVFTLPISIANSQLSSVYINGVRQTPDVDYEFTSATVVTLLGGSADAGDVVQVLASTIPSSSSGSSLYTTPGAISRTVQARLRDRVSAKDFGAVGDGVTDDTVALQAFFDFATSIASAKRRPVLYIPTGKYAFTALTVSDVEGAGVITRGNAIITGEGITNTELMCTSPTADAITLKSGKIELSGILLTVDGINRSANVGTGHGIVVDASDGVAPSGTYATSVARFIFNNVQILDQPYHGMYLLNPELVSVNDVACATNGWDGFRIDGTNGGSTKGISNIFMNCRALDNGVKAGINTNLYGRGLTNMRSQNQTFVNFQVLRNRGDDAIFDSGLGSIFINPDIEAQNITVQGGGATDFIPIGMRLSGNNTKVLGGIIGGFEDSGIVLQGQRQVVDGTHFTNAGLSYAMDRAVSTISATNYSLNNLNLNRQRTITGATQANPVVITSTAHEFANSNSVTFHQVGGMTNLSGNTYTVANVTANTFELSGINGTGYGAFTTGGKVDTQGQNIRNTAWHTSNASANPHTGGYQNIGGHSERAIAVQTLISGDSTPTVRNGSIFQTAGTTAITAFDDGYIGKTITILATASITITDGSPIILAGGANFAMVNTDTLMLTQFASGVWSEVSRSVN